MIKKEIPLEERIMNFNKKLLKSKVFWGVVIALKPLKWLIFSVILVKLFS